MKFKKIYSAVVAVALCGSSAVCADDIPVWSADALPWQIERPGGARLTFLEGDPKAPGSVVTYAFKMPDGAWFPAHRHPATARIFVLKGVLLLGEGAVADRAMARRISAGQAALVPAGLVHFEGAEGETVIIGVAVGPWRTDFVRP